MKLSDSIKLYLEPNNGVVGLTPLPSENSCDNGLLFSSVFIVLLSVYEPEEINQWRAWFHRIVHQRTIQPGCYFRRLNEPGVPSHWDDHIGIALAGYCLKSQHPLDIWSYGIGHLGFWGKEFLWRIPLFFLMSRFTAKEKLGLLERWALRLIYSFNMLEPASETSGKVILLCSYFCIRGLYPDLDETLEAWIKQHSKWYPASYIAGELEIYYGPTHPFTVFMKSRYQQDQSKMP